MNLFFDRHRGPEQYPQCRGTDWVVARDLDFAKDRLRAALLNVEPLGIISVDITDPIGAEFFEHVNREICMFYFSFFTGITEPVPFAYAPNFALVSHMNADGIIPLLRTAADMVVDLNKVRLSHHLIKTKGHHG